MAFSRAAAKASGRQPQINTQDLFQNKTSFDWRSGARPAEQEQVSWGSVNDVRSAGASSGTAGISWGSVDSTRAAGASAGTAGISWGSVDSSRAKASSGYEASGYGPGAAPKAAGRGRGAFSSAVQNQYQAPPKAPPKAAAAPATLGGARAAQHLDEEKELSKNKRVFEVLYKSPVRVEPHLESRKISTKSVGARLYANQVTMNGWLKLDGEAGWILMDMRGMEELGEVVQRQEEVQVAIGGYHAQGICCCEVFYAQVAVRSAPSRTAPQLGLRYKYEYVFAHSQNFDGWVKLANEPGWMLFQSADFGRLLEPRFDQNALHTDLQALCDVWKTARQAESKEMREPTVKQLKELEAKALETAYQWYAQLASGDPREMQDVVDKAEISMDDLSLPEAWLMRRLFRSAIEKTACNQAFKKLVPDLVLSTPYPPMMVEEDPAVEAMHVDINGTIYILGIGGILLDKETHEIVGRWDPDAEALEPLPEGFDAAAGVAIFQHQGAAYLMNSEGLMLEPMTMRVVGQYNKSTQQIDPLYGEIRIDEPGYGQAVDEVIDIPKHLLRGQESAKKRRFNTAIDEFDTALRGCEQLRSCDLDVESEILHGRAACLEEIGEYERLLKDAERLLEYDDKNFQALKWKALAISRLKDTRR